jgi:predicted N-acetyltransferase YhbS
MENILIRALRVNDTDHVWRIFTDITKSNAIMNYARSIEEQVQQDDSASFVAERDGQVVGFMICNIVACGFGLLDKSAWIVMLGVDPKFMGQGIGKLLAEKTFTVCKEKGIQRIYSSVGWDSPDLLSFFKTLGFDRSNFINLKREL